MAYSNTIALSTHRDMMKDCAVREAALRDRIDDIRDTYGISTGLRCSYELSFAREKFYRFAHNLNLEKTKKWFVKSKEVLLRALESAEENPTCAISDEMPESEDVSTMEFSHKEGALLTIGKQMTDFQKVGESIIKMVEKLK
jgi:hypothetical protein